MKKLKAITHFIMLITTPTLIAHPQNNLTQVTFQAANYWYNQGTQEWVCPTTYDEIMQKLEDLESGELERRYSPMQLKHVNDYLALLAKEGILPDELDEEMALEEDIEDLMYGEDSAFKLEHYLENSTEHMIIPTVLSGYSGYNIVQCGKISRGWKKTKKFVKKHKKAIIIGAVVVVASTVVIVAVVTTSCAGAATATAGAAGVAASSAGSESGSSNSQSRISESKEEITSDSTIPREAPTPADVTNAPIMRTAINEHISSFKEFLMEDKSVQQSTSPKGLDEPSFGEKVREIGANIAHQAYDEIADLVKVVPELCEEVKEIGFRLLPESLTAPNNGDRGSSIENYENLVAKGHEVIDKVFSTDQAELFTAEVKANNMMNEFAIGMPPLPGGIPKIFSNTGHLIKAGNTIDRSGFTRVGRGLMKHGHRKGSVFPKPLGNSAEMNRRGESVLREILNDPKRTIFKNNKGGIEIYAPNGRGAYFREDGIFRGFIEYGHK